MSVTVLGGSGGLCVMHFFPSDFRNHLFPEVRMKLLSLRLVKLRNNTMICGSPYKAFISTSVYFLIPFHAIILG